MAQDLFQYDKMVERALRGVVRDALKRAAREGLRGGHHFYLGFVTQMPGVEIDSTDIARPPRSISSRSRAIVHSRCGACKPPNPDRLPHAANGSR